MNSGPLLFQPFRLRDVTFPNRVVIAPMQMYQARSDGKATDWHFQHLAKYAIGGAGTVMTEALIVDPIGRNTYGDLGIWSDEHVAPLRRIADFLKQLGMLAAALNDPHWGLHAAQALGIDPDSDKWPPSYGWWLQLRDAIGIEA